MAVPVKVSAKSARLPFNPCGPKCISLGCTGKCCDAPTRPGGCFVTIHPSEVARITARGGVVVGGLLQPVPGATGCPFKRDGLCTLHGTPDKPFGCIASPFTVNKHRTLIIRNRYKLLPCYNSGEKLPAYLAFFSSLVLLFGNRLANEIKGHLDNGGGDRVFMMPEENYLKLVDNDRIKHGESLAREGFFW